MSEPTDLGPWDDVGDWLLRFGFWEDEAQWSDSGAWKDVPDTWTVIADNATVWGEA